MNLKEILRMKEVQHFSGSNKQLFNYVKKLVKMNVGHGISAEYYATRFEFECSINPNNIGTLVKSAKFNKGCFSKYRMNLGLKAYQSKQKIEKQLKLDIEKK